MTGVTGATGATGPSGGPVGPTGPTGNGSGGIITLQFAVDYSNNAVFPSSTWQEMANYLVNFTDLPVGGNYFRLTGWFYVENGGSGNVRIVINGNPVWTSAPITNLAYQGFDSGPIPYANPYYLSTVELQGYYSGAWNLKDYCVTIYFK